MTLHCRSSTAGRSVTGLEVLFLSFITVNAWFVGTSVTFVLKTAERNFDDTLPNEF
jgi:hypothetical protein